MFAHSTDYKGTKEKLKHKSSQIQDGNAGILSLGRSDNNTHTHSTRGCAVFVTLTLVQESR